LRYLTRGVGFFLFAERADGRIFVTRIARTNGTVDHFAPPDQLRHSAGSPKKKELASFDGASDGEAQVWNATHLPFG
jgi:hypothetical protein